MKIQLCFDYYSKIIYIPDSYITNLNKIYHDFFEWIDSQPSCLDDKGISYDAHDFLRYVNDEILMNSQEKAYILPGESEKKIPRLRF